MRDKQHETESNLSPFLTDNPYAVDAIKKIVRENLDGISAQKVHEYTHEQVIPHFPGHFLDRNWSEDDNKSCVHTVHNYIISISKREVLNFYGIREFCITTVYNWTNIMGMRYCNREKNYYVYWN